MYQNIKVSFTQRWDEDGTHYNQGVRITAAIFEQLKNIVNCEIALRYPNKNEYGDPLYLTPLQRIKGTVFLNHTQTRFINNYLKLKLKDRNTYGDISRRMCITLYQKKLTS